MRENRFVALVGIILCVLLLSDFAYGQEVQQEEFEGLYTSFGFTELDKYPKAKFKLWYSLSTGYSSRDRYGYSIMIVDSLLVLEFESPNNDDWDFVNYRRERILEGYQIERLKKVLVNVNLVQIKDGVPLPDCTGYELERLKIESSSTNISGGMICCTIGEEGSLEDYYTRITHEKQQSSSIGGDYLSFISTLESLFPQLDELLVDKDKVYEDTALDYTPDSTFHFLPEFFKEKKIDNEGFTTQYCTCEGFNLEIGFQEIDSCTILESGQIEGKKRLIKTRVIGTYTKHNNVWTRTDFDAKGKVKAISYWRVTNILDGEELVGFVEDPDTGLTNIHVWKYYIMQVLRIPK